MIMRLQSFLLILNKLFFRGNNMDIKTARKLAQEYGLEGPAWALDTDIPIQDIIDRIGSTGGCGPGKWGDWLVPDTVYGLSIKPACYIHDCNYSEADTPEKRYEADLRLFRNSRRIIKLNSNKFMCWLRMLRMSKYYVAVDLGGGSFAKD